jgi:hypothetical protein
MHSKSNHSQTCSYGYNQLKGMLIQLSPMQLVQKIEVTRGEHGYISMSSCFPSFIVRWILNFVYQLTHENHENWYHPNKSDLTVFVPTDVNLARI